MFCHYRIGVSWCILCMFGLSQMPIAHFDLVGWSWWPFRVETMISGFAQLCQHEPVAPTTLAKRPHYFSILIYIYIYIYISQLQRLQKLANVMYLKVKASRVSVKSSQGFPIFPYISQSYNLVPWFPVYFPSISIDFAMFSPQLHWDPWSSAGIWGLRGVSHEDRQ